MPSRSPAEKTQKVVAHKLDGSLLKGFIAGGFGADSVMGTQPPAPPARLEIRPVNGNASVKVKLDDLKALFFVKSFEGSKAYHEVKFFNSQPLLEGLWVRLRFKDNESTEGIIYNSLINLVSPGFFLKPPDPSSNNEIVYVLKDSLSDFRILGVRSNY